MNASLEHPLIAVLDDVVVMGELVKTMLTKRGVEVELFLLGKELLDSPNLLKFKSIVMDLSIPDIDGFDLMEMLAARNISAPITVISGHENGVLQAAQIYGNGLGLKVEAVLSKPFTSDNLLAALGLPE